MTETGLVRAGWVRVKEYLPAVMAAGLMYGGINQILSVLKYLLSGVALTGINEVIRLGFRDRVPLENDYWAVPWTYHVRPIAGAIIVLVVGMFLGLWANARNQQHPSH